MNTAALIKKALKLTEVYLKEEGLEKVFQNKTIDSTDIIADARTGVVEIEQTYRKQFKIKKDTYIISIEYAITIVEVDGGPAHDNRPIGTKFNVNWSGALTRLDEFDMEVPIDHPFGTKEDVNFPALYQFINRLPKFKPKSLDEVKV